MPEKITVPFLTHPDVRAREGELTEAREAERLTVEMKVTLEEMYAIADEIRPFFHYKDLVASPAFTEFQRDETLYQQIIAELQAARQIRSSGTHEEWLQNTEDAVKEKLKQRFLEEAATKEGTDLQKVEQDFEANFIRARIQTSAGRENGLSLTDLIYFLKENEDVLCDSIYDSVYETVEKKIKSNADTKSNLDTKEEIDAIYIGTITKLEMLLSSSFDHALNKIEAFSDEDKLKIEAYAKSSLPEIKKIILDIKALKRGLKVHAVAGVADVIRKKSDLAAIYKTTEEKISKSQDRLQRNIKKKTGKDFRMAVEEIYEAHVDAVDKDFLTAYVNYSQELRELEANLVRGVVVETDYVRKIKEKAMPYLRKGHGERPTVVYLHGDFGTGKTAIAKHIAHKLVPDREAIVVSGSKFLDPDRFTEEFRVAKMKPNEFLTEIYGILGKPRLVEASTSFDQIAAEFVGTKQQMRERIIANLKMENGNKPISDQELKDINDQLDNFYNNQVQGRYVLGAMYEAMRTGVPLIIDEANAITPDVMIALNDALTKRIGDAVQSRAGNFQIKEGYCIMYTGNTGDRYKQARFGNKDDTDPASYSRIIPIEVRYLPNDRTVNNIEQVLNKLDLSKISEKAFENPDAIDAAVAKSRQDAKDNQIYQVLVTKLLNRRLGRELLTRKDDRYSIFKDISRLATGTRIIMDIFERNDWKDAAGNSTFPSLSITGITGQADNFTTYKEDLKVANLSMRELMDNIVGGYLESGCNMDIEYYLWQYVNKYSDHPREQAVIYRVLQLVEFFQPEQGWPEITSISGDNALDDMRTKMEFDPLDKVEKYKRIRKNGEFATLLELKDEYTLEYFSSLETMQLVFGYLPARKVEEYQAVQQKIVEARSRDRAAETIKPELVNSLEKDLNSTLAVVFDDRKYASSDEAITVVNEIKAHPFIAAFTEKGTAAYQEMSDAELFEQAENFYNLLLDISVRSGKISQEAADAAKTGDPSSKAEIIRNAWST